MCQECGIAFIGPSPELIEKMGNKSEAKQTMKEAGIPVVPGTDFPVSGGEEALEEANKIGFPVMIKASAGGGGKGMRLAYTQQEFPALFHAAQQEAINAFGDGTMYLERYVQAPRHVEVQIIGDRYGNVVHLGERDCSIREKASEDDRGVTLRLYFSGDSGKNVLHGSGSGPGSGIRKCRNHRIFAGSVGEFFLWK